MNLLSVIGSCKIVKGSYGTRALGSRRGSCTVTRLTKLSNTGTLKTLEDLFLKKFTDTLRILFS